MMVEESNTSPPHRIAICVCFLNAGVSTVGLAIGQSLRTHYPDSDICFFSWEGPPGMTYDFLAKRGSNNDFDVIHYGVPVDQSTWTALLEAEHSGTGFPFDFARTLNANVWGLVEALRTFQPHVVVHGLVPEATMACQILGLPNILYGPVPYWDRSWMRDNKPNPSILPSHSSSNPFQEVALQLGLDPSRPVYEATHYLLTDLASHYTEYDFPETVHVVGPLMATPVVTEAVDCNDHCLSKPVQEWLRRYQMCSNKVFVMLGSTGSKEFIVEAVRALRLGGFPALVAVPKIRCSREEILQALAEDGLALPDTSIVLTEEFLPVRFIAPRVDCIVGHGGQGTVHAAVVAGKPFLGFALQFEQGWHLEQCIVKPHAGIVLTEWTAPSIQRSIEQLLHDSSYQQGAVMKQRELKQAVTRSSELSVQVIVSVATSACAKLGP